MLDGRSVFDRVEQSRPDSDEDRTGSDNVFESTNEGNDPRRGDENNDLGKDEWQQSNASIGSREVVGCLHTYREVVDFEHERSEEEEQHDRGASMISATRAVI